MKIEADFTRVEGTLCESTLQKDELRASEPAEVHDDGGCCPRARP